MPLKRLLTANDGGVWGDDPKDGEGTVVLRSTDQSPDGTWRLSEPALRALTARERVTATLVEGDLLVTKSSGSAAHIGKTTYVTRQVAQMKPCFSNFMQRLRVRSGVAPRIVWYWLNSDLGRQQLAQLSNTTTGLANLNSDILGRLQIPAVPLEEQRRIVEFLDYETALVDELVKDQDLLIALIAEKRQAVICSAVTKGLAVDAEMVDTDVQWLGKVPSHWRMMKGAVLGSLFGSEAVPEESVVEDGDVPFLKVSSLQQDSFAVGSWDYFVDRSMASKLRSRRGYVVFPKRGAAIFTNKVAIVDRLSVIDPNLMGWAIGKQAEPAYVAYCLKCRRLGELADVSTVPQINAKHIAPERFPVPPLEEQRLIVAHLDSELERLRALGVEVGRSSNLLLERRSALITAAVTGQIDVRSWRPSDDWTAPEAA